MNLEMQRSEMATCVEAPKGLGSKGKHYYRVWQTMFEIDRKYVPVRGIGRGAYGVVCSSVNVETNERVAIKKVNNVLGQGKRVDALRTLRELMLLRCIRHENVIALRDVMMPSDCRGFRDVYMVYELMDTDLHRIISSSFPLSNNHCKYFVFQVLRGLKYLHSANVLHRDLKPGNLLVNASNCELKICDFGLARTSGQLMTEYVVTRWYRAPELLLSCDNYDSSIDVWSVGCILAEILGRKPIFPGTDTLTQLRLILSVVGSQPDADLEFIDNTKARRFVRSIQFPRRTLFSCLYPHADPLAIDLLERMLVFDPSKRITVTDALSHPYLSGLYDPNCNPPAQYRINVDVDENIGEGVIREMMLREILCYHPQAARANAM